MGKKGDKLTNDSVLSTELLLDRINSIKGITSKKMFGGHGIFHDSQMFGIVDSKGQCYLKAGDSTRPNFEEMDAKKHGRMPYFTIPEEVMDDSDILQKWVKQSIEISKK